MVVVGNGAWMVEMVEADDGLVAWKQTEKGSDPDPDCSQQQQQPAAPGLIRRVGDEATE